MGMAKKQAIAAAERGYVYTEDATICLSHITDLYLQQQAGPASETTCSFCDRSDDEAFAVAFEGVQEVFMNAFWNYYGRADDAPRWEGEYHGLEDTNTAVGELAVGSFDDDVVDDIATALTNAIEDFEVSTWFTPMATDDLELSWSAFEQTARHVSRFIVPNDDRGRSPMARVSSFLRQLLLYVEGDHNLVRTMEPGTRVYRGRPIETVSGKLYHTAEDLGPAPADKATANRMSPAGIPMFYCSADPVTAVAEIAVHDIRPFAVIGEFTSRRPLRILDLTKVQTRPSPFDPDHGQTPGCCPSSRSSPQTSPAPSSPTTASTSSTRQRRSSPSTCGGRPSRRSTASRCAAARRVHPPTFFSSARTRSPTCPRTRKRRRHHLVH